MTETTQKERDKLNSWVTMHPPQPPQHGYDIDPAPVILATIRDANLAATYERACVKRSEGAPASESVTDESIVDEYLSEYEWRGEDHFGREACYTPSDNERAMLKDFAMGLLSELSIRQHEQGE